MKQFKKLLALLLCVVMCISLIACGSSDENIDEDDEEEKKEEVKEKEGDEDCIHVWGEEENKNSKPCTKKSTITRTCEDCGRVEIVCEIPAEGHTYDFEKKRCAVCDKKAPVKCEHDDCSWVTIRKADCLNDGYRHFICKKCDFVQDSEYLHSEGHKYVNHTRKEATCTEPGYKSYDTCEKCDYTTFEVIEAKGHGFIAGKCGTCGEVDADFTLLTKSAKETKVYKAEASEIKEITCEAAVITNHKGEIASEEQVDTYTFTATVDGEIRIWLNEVMAEAVLKLEVKDKLNASLASDDFAKNNDGLTVGVTAGEEYTITVGGKEEKSAYILYIGDQKKTVDVSEAGKVTDKIEYVEQTVNYTFIPKTAGKYRFDFNEMMSDSVLSVKLCNHLNEVVTSDTYLINGEGLSAELTVGETYKIVVRQEKNFCDYVMTVGTPNEVKDVTDYTAVQDSISYAKQINKYSFTPKADGVYCFKITDMSDKASVVLSIVDKRGFTMTLDSYCKNNDDIHLELEGGETYTLKVEYDEGFSDYTLNLCYPDEPLAITGNTGVNEHFRFETEVKVYNFTANEDGDYLFIVANMTQAYSYCVMELRDTNGTLVASNSRAYNNEWITLKDASKGDAYTLTIKQEGNLPSFALAVQPVDLID